MNNMTNGTTANSVDVIDEGLRLAYLQAMDIDCWEPKKPFYSTDAEELALQQAIGAEEAKTNAASSTTENNTSESMVLNNETIDDQHVIVPSDTESDDRQKAPSAIKRQKSSVDIQAEKELTEDQPEAEINVVQANKVRNNKFLKLVNWTNQTIKEENSKKLLIICRHQIDQPASSFARPNSPSQFMLDYINALSGFIQEQTFELNISMAHLSEAGLSKDSVPMADILQQQSPDLILILGDETVSHLLDKQANVASLRGQLVELEQQNKAIVSYHPFSMIENPSLKSLALEDLSILASCFNQPNES